MKRPSTAFLLLPLSPDALSSALRQLLVDDERLASVHAGMGSLGSFELTCDGIGYRAKITANIPNISDYRSIFWAADVKNIRSTLTLDLSDHVAGGQFVPPIAAGYLALLGQFATAFRAEAVLWTPGNLAVQADYFINAVREYGEGGPFPVLATVDLVQPAQNCALASVGLDWFAGQEIEIVAEDDRLNAAELVRRAVRLVHDIATCGPILQQQDVTDLDADSILELRPNAAATRLLVHIRPKMNHANQRQ